MKPTQQKKLNEYLNKYINKLTLPYFNCFCQLFYISFIYITSFSRGAKVGIFNKALHLYYIYVTEWDHLGCKKKLFPQG